MSSLKTRGQAGTGEKFAVMEVTPALASEWLGTMQGNRNPKQSRVDKYVEEIVNGRWELNGESIKFDKEGRLFDGQHRLMAVAKSGRPILSAVFFGGKNGTLYTVDTGRSRNFADVLHMRGEVSTALLAAAVRRYWLYERNGSFSNSNRNESGQLCMPTMRELMEWFEKNTGIRDSIRKVAEGGGSDRSLLKTGLGVALHYMFSKLEPHEDADLFFQMVNSGANLAETDPVFRLRGRMLDHAMGKNRMTPNETAAVTIKAWNFWRSGTKIQNLLWRGGGTAAEAFPVPK